MLLDQVLSLWTLNLKGIFLPCLPTLLHSEGQNPLRLLGLVGMPSPSLNILVNPPSLLLGPTRSPSPQNHYPLPVTCPVFVSFCILKPKDPKDSYFVFLRWGWGWQALVSSSPEWVRPGTLWQSDCSQDQTRLSPRCPHVQGQWPWIGETPVSRPSICARIFQSLKWQKLGSCLSFLEMLERNLIQSTKIFSFLSTF